MNAVTPLQAMLESDLAGLSGERARRLCAFSQAAFTGDFRPLEMIPTRELRQLAAEYGHLAFERRFATAMLAEHARRARKRYTVLQALSLVFIAIAVGATLVAVAEAIAWSLWG